MKVDPDKLSFELFTTSDDLSTLDFAEEDYTDPLGIDDFIKNRFNDYLQNNLTSIWTVRYEGHIVAYFTASMFAIQTRQLLDDEQILLHLLWQGRTIDPEHQVIPAYCISGAKTQHCLWQ
jgi:hypothetical protein